MPREIRREPGEIAPDLHADAVGKTRRFRIRIRDWLLVVVLVALVAAGVAQRFRERRLQALNALAEALRLQRADMRKAEAFIKRMDRIKVPSAEIRPSLQDRNGVFPILDRLGLPDDRAREKLTRAQEDLDRARRDLAEIMKDYKIEEIHPPQKDRDGVFPDPDSRGLPDDGRSVL